jgi:O-antigen/teichoic acid export membrane protein
LSRLGGRLRGLGVGADTTLTMVLQAGSAVAAFALQLVILRVLTRADADIYARTITYLALASAFADFGIAAVVLPRLAVSGSDAPSLKAGLVLRLVSVLIAWLVINLYLLIVGHHELLLYVNISYVAIFFSARLIGMRQFIEIVWRLQGRTYVVTAVALADTVLLTLGVIVLALVDALSIERVLLLYAFSSIPGFALIVWPLWKNGRLGRFLSVRLKPRYYRALLAAAVPVAVMVVAGQTFAQLEPLVIEAYLEVGAVAGFRAATSPLTGLIFLPVAISYGLSPVISQISRGIRRDIDMGTMTSVAVRILGSLALAICAVCYLFGYQIMMLFGPKYIGETPILMLYSISNGITFFVILFDAFLLAMGYRKQVLAAAVVGFVAALTLELLLVREYAVPGLIAAKIGAQMVIIVWQLRSFQPTLRRGALAGLARLAMPAALLAGSLVATASLPLIPRAMIVLALLGGSLLLARVVRPEELQQLRRMKLDGGGREG